MSLIAFQEQVEEASGKRLKIVINDNRSTMLSVRWEPDCTRVSLHRFFLHAPQNIMDALVCYINKKHKVLSPDIRAFIEDNVKKLDYSHLLDDRKLQTRGRYYDLKRIFNDINEEYFEGRLPLKITWFGSHDLRHRTHVTFGLYHDPLKLIKINRLLDDPDVPEYFIRYVVYHEMLHFVCPSYIDERGIHRIHSKEFKEKEVEFSHFYQAQDWVNRNFSNLFADY